MAAARRDHRTRPDPGRHHRWQLPGRSFRIAHFPHTQRMWLLPFICYLARCILFFFLFFFFLRHCSRHIKLFFHASISYSNVHLHNFHHLQLSSNGITFPSIMRRTRGSYFLLKKFPDDHFCRTNMRIKELPMTWRNSICIIPRHFGD